MSLPIPTTQNGGSRFGNLAMPIITLLLPLALSAIGAYISVGVAQAVVNNRLDHLEQSGRDRKDEHDNFVTREFHDEQIRNLRADLDEIKKTTHRTEGLLLRLMQERMPVGSMRGQIRDFDEDISGKP